MALSSTTKEGSESNSSKPREAPSFANFMLSAQVFQKPFFGVRPMKPNLNAAVAAANSVRQLHQSINSTADKCLRFLLLFATRNPVLRNVLSLSSNLTRHFSEVQCRSFRNASSGHHNFAAILPGDSVAGVVVANGILNFLNIYNTLLIVRLVLTWFPNSPPAIVSPLSTLCDPYLNIFRGIIPPLGGTLDLSPILAFLVLNAFTSTAAALPAELPTSGSSQGIYTYPQTSAGLTTSQEKWMRRLRGNKSNNSSSR